MRPVRPDRPPDISLRSVLHFWWKEMVQGNDATYSNFKIVYKDGKLFYYDQSQYPWPYSDLEWFKENEEEIMRSFSTHLLEMEMLDVE